MNLFKDLLNVKLKENTIITGCNDEFFCLFLNNLLIREKKSILVVVNSIYEVNNLYSNLLNYTNKVKIFPMDDFLTSEALSISPDLMISRLDTLDSICSDLHCIVITNLMGYLRFLPNKCTYINHILNFKVGDIISPSDLVNKLLLNGYKRDTIVTKTGEYAVRGFIIDIYPLYENNPIRIEFFDNEIESIRYFDSNTQTSLENIDSITIKPYTEFLYNSCDYNEEKFGRQKYLYEYENVVSINEYFNNGYTFFKDFKELEVNYNKINDDILNYKNKSDKSYSGKYIFKLQDINVKYKLYYNSINNIVDSLCHNEVINFNVSSISNFNEDINQINNFIKKGITSNKTIFICLKDYQLKAISKKLNAKYKNSNISNYSLNCVNLLNVPINTGFIYNQYIFLTANELFINKEKKNNYVNKYKYSTSLTDFSKLEKGDFVVHNIHGIGLYNGIKTLKFNNYIKDYLEILYQDNDKIYIPVEKIDSLSKYSGNEGSHPKLSKLGGNDWKKTKARVKSKIDGVADKLLALYAARDSKRGFSFSKDCDMSIDFLNDFPYELTKDQFNAINQIKKDMESNIPMDRLLCGDVGFGKTEVAFVAAFKAILDSKQVLFLCPTTILSSQHYQNALERFKNFPVSIGLLNRFTSLKDKNKILEQLSNGTIDMVIGTHRLLSNDVKVKDLGLLIIDEEQRFGVLHKEKIKEYKNNIDVLTLTATPIPRTLQMSLVGIRSLSLIETPPVNRYPVQTYVVEENLQIIKDAIYKELSRNGQVFILYNKVQSIEDEAFKISKLVPEAKVAIAHGQMKQNQLENRVLEFINHKYDVLVCTTIIETGIDIPNVNTLIIIDSDRFGLSQLYQIRGRVGRSDRFAYAYLMYNPSKILTETAKKRLNVIKEFTDLGSGFAIAARDLSIRGAGDILGSEQAGFIDSVGIDLYLKMLNDEVNKRKKLDTVMEEDNDVETDSKPLINVNTHIGSDYVMEDDLKILIHKKINEIDSYQKFQNIKKELEDRFGKLTEDLIIYMYEEWFEKICKKLNIKQVKQTKNSIEVYLSKEFIGKLNMEEIFVDAFNISPMFRFISKDNYIIIVLDIIKLDNHPIYYLVKLFDNILTKFIK